MLVVTDYIGQKDADQRWLVEPAEQAASPHDIERVRRDWRQTQQRKPVVWITPRDPEDLQRLSEQTVPEQFVTVEPVIRDLLKDGKATFAPTQYVDQRNGRYYPKDTVSVAIGSATPLGFDLACLLLQPDRWGLVFVEAEQEAAGPIPMDPASPKKNSARKGKR